jgi:hypothetical protein
MKIQGYPKQQKQAKEAISGIHWKIEKSRIFIFFHVYSFFKK